MKQSRRQLVVGRRAEGRVVGGFTHFSVRHFCPFGVALGLAAFGAGAASAQTNYIVLESFASAGLTGSNPVAELVEGSDGALYGVAGTVFRLEKDGRGAQTFHTFASTAGDGQGPMAGLVELSDGFLYGTTAYGGAPSGLGYGTVFRLDKDGNGYEIVHRFGQVANDGRYAGGGLTAVGSVLYGTTWDGGTAGLGTIFRLNGDGSGYAVVRSFRGGASDLAQPRQRLVKGSDGALYGLAAYGSNTFAGAVYKINPEGTGYTVLRNFSESGGDASGPWGLMEGSDGVLYGTSKNGGSAGYGAMFKLGKDGAGYSVVRSFVHDGVDGIQPETLVEGNDGALYGTTSAGGRYEGGTIFKVNKNGSGYTILRHFRNGSEAGWNPSAGLVQGSDGVLYGTTYYSVGDGLGPGVVFALSSERRSWFVGWTVGAGGVSTLEARGAAEVQFRLQWATGLEAPSWQAVRTNRADALGSLRFTNLSTSPTRRFFRMVTP